MDASIQILLFPLAALLCGAPAYPQQTPTRQMLRQLVDEAEACLDREDYACAAGRFHDAAQLAPPSAEELLGHLYLQRSKALAAIKKWLAAYDSAVRAAEYLKGDADAQKQQVLTEDEASKLVRSAEDITRAFRPVAGSPGTQQVELWIPFAFDSHEIDEGREQTDELARYMQEATKKKAGHIRFHLIGHTDKQGEPDYNIDLSRRRAASVKAYLEGTGIPEPLLSMEGRGESELRRQGDTEDDHRVNRRVVVQEIVR